MKMKKDKMGSGGYKNMGPNGQLPNQGYDKSKSTPQSQGNSVDMGGYSAPKGVSCGLSNPTK